MAITMDAQHRVVKTNLDLTEARYSEWQWHQLGRMQACTSLQRDSHASVFTPEIFKSPLSPPYPEQMLESSHSKNINLEFICNNWLF